MRAVPILLMLAACSPEAPEERPAEIALYAGEGRDRLCIAGERIGFITYGKNDANCSVRGRMDRSGGKKLEIVPDGDEDCTLELEEQGNMLRISRQTESCAYYCGPGAAYGGRSFIRNPSASPAVDFAGDALC